MRARRCEMLALALILLLAALLRLLWPAITEFKLDEALITTQAWDLAEFKQFPLHGTRSSIGMYLPPFGIYLYALPLRIWPHPLSAVLFTGIVNVIAVALCWWLGRRYWGMASGLCAALFLATSPWAVLFSRKIWEPDLIPVLSLAYIITGLLGLLERRAWAVAAHLILLAVIVQVHFSGIVLVPLTAVLLLLYRKQIVWRALLLGLVIAALSLLPFARYLWRDRHEVRQVLAKLMAQPAFLDGQALRLWWIAAVGADLHAITGARAFREFLRSTPDLDVLRWALGAILLGGLGYWLYSALRRSSQVSEQAGGIVALWILAPLLVFLRRSTPLHLHYFVTALPGPCLVFGYLAARALGSSFRGLRVAALSGFVATVTVNAILVVSLLRFVATHPTPGGFGLPLKAQLSVAEAAIQRGRPIVVVSRGDNPAHNEGPAVFGALLRRVPHRFIDGTRVALFPQSPATLLFTPGTSEALRIYRLSGAVEPLDEFPSFPDEEPFRIMCVDGQPSLDLEPVRGPRRLGNGAEVIGYRVSGRAAPKQNLEWWVAWRVRKCPMDPEVDYHIFNHLLDFRGKRWAQADSGTVRTSDWAPGDVVVQMFRIEIPGRAEPAPYWMYVGMYTYPGLTNEPVLDNDGYMPMQAVVLGPIEDQDQAASPMTE